MEWMVFFLVFIAMEGMAWFTHKYIMHGILWSWHKDHHQKDEAKVLERNDRFFVFYALLSISAVLMWKLDKFELGLAVGGGIFAYGLTYFLVHDVFIHRRLKWFQKIDNAYAKGIRKAHKVHHKNRFKKKGQCFGMLLVPLKYFKS